MTGRKLTAHNASVTTMTVEVKTLTIGTRQVTQGIFRQLIEEPLIAEDGSLNGVPWGHVSWHPDGKHCGYYSRRRSDGRAEERPRRDNGHLHVVWQRRAALYRSLVYSAEAEEQRFQYGPPLEGTWRSSYHVAWDELSDEARQRHREVRATLAQLPQLFIGG